MQNKLKILHVINSLTRGGAETLVVNSLTPGGINEQADNYLLYFIKGDYLSSLVDKNVTQVCLDYKGGTDIFRLFRRMRKIIREGNFDIIHTHLNPADFYVSLAKPKNIPQVHTVHIAYSADFETRKSFKFLEKFLYFKRNDCNLIFLSSYTEKDFLETVSYTGRHFVLNNFIDDSFFGLQGCKYNPGTGETLRIIAVGNFRAQKNYFYMLEIFRHLKDCNIELDIYGGGDTAAYEEIIRANNLKVNLKGQKAKIDEVISGYHLFMMSSINEGFPLSVFEAMAASVPLMLSDIPPLKSIVEEHAVYFELGDAAKAASIVMDIAMGKIDISQMAQHAKQHAEKMARRDVYIKNLFSIYNNVLHHAP
ncbi:MAG: glycosyltransferase [Ferruginibacter sp.]